MQIDRLDPAAAQVVDLVFHEGNERRYYNRHTVESHCRHLKCDGFSTACRHKSKSGTTAKYGIYDIFLQRAERAVAPVLFEQGMDVGGGVHCSEGLMSRIISWMESGLFERLVCSIV